MTYADVCARLERAGVESAEWDAQLLIEHYMGVDRLVILSDPDRLYESADLEEAVFRRERREPLQYILGEWAFFRQNYEVSPACLVPRSDTEVLVEQAIRLLPQNAFFADLCTGSGCIAVSTLAERPDTRAWAMELSKDALAVAARNAQKNGVSDRLRLLHEDVLSPSEQADELVGSLDALLSNPPYIQSGVIQTLAPEVLQEPRMALDGGEDGLIFYRALLTLADKWLKQDGFCLFEIGYDQGEQIKLLAQAQGFTCEVLRDLGGCDRVAHIRRRRI